MMKEYTKYILTLFLLFFLSGYVTVLVLLDLHIAKDRSLPYVPIKEEEKNTLPYSVAVVGIARDIAERMRRNIEKVMDILPMFRKYVVYIYENDSRDGSQKVLQDAQARYGSDVFRYVSKIGVDPKLAVEYHGGNTRYIKMARYRNECVYELRKPDYSDIDYVIVVDWDHMGMFTSQDMKTIFGGTDPIIEQCDGLFANAKNDVPRRRNLFNALFYTDSTYDKLAMVYPDDASGYGTRLFTGDGNELIHMKSAFSGVGIYPKHIMDKFEYRGDVCEHICLHEDMWKAGYTRTYILSSFVFNH